MELLYGLEVTAEIEVIKAPVVIPAGTLKLGDVIKVSGNDVTIESPEDEK